MNETSKNLTFPILNNLPYISQKIKEFMNESHIYRYETSINEDTQLNLYSLLVAIFAVGGMLGGLLAGWWADFFGRCVIIHVERIKHIRRSQEMDTQIAENIHVDRMKHMHVDRMKHILVPEERRKHTCIVA